ncbi:AcrR family transcriptional regulator [Spinactinospora alkalitolerans]|uniref:AcrR family transcriptional regulator n=1 Tax=Spinactinospora alkalitolerans TaxID=687207 RepID=A0A852U2B2_9ACTN|nr:TetR/AcrR family transcriptional regulator [Spinactinospora alkalitolerans]NYE48110.1 AcrR family transcriptional regulator [Spinactinospora alkalitolerans]
MTPPTPAERGREVREKLLAAARALIGELGWNAVSTRILAQRAGVRPGLVHYHFESLPALLRRAALDAMRRTLDDTAAVLAGAATPADGVDAMLSFLDHYTGRDPESLLFSEAYLVATRDEELRARMSELIADFHGDLAERLARAGHHAPEDAATLLMAVLDGFVLHKGLDPGLSAARIAPLVRDIVTARGEGEGEKGENR